MKPLLRLLRSCLSVCLDGKVLVFALFLALSAVFWLLMTLNESYEQEIVVPVAIVDVPDNVVLTSDAHDTLRVTVRDKGFTLLEYLFGDGVRTVKIPFKAYTRTNSQGLVPPAEVQRLLYQKLAAGTRIQSVKPERIDYSYNHGARKRVPVRWSGRVLPEHLYFISSVDYSPDSVDVFASDEKLDSINVAYTEQLNYAGFRDTLRVAADLQKVKGVKYVPDRVKITFYTDVLTEATIGDIPVVGINLPAGKTIRTFPARATVRFVTGMSQYKKLRPQDFRVVADYRDILAHPSDKCTLFLDQVPHGISRAQLETKYVDYLIEEQSPAQ